MDNTNADQGQKMKYMWQYGCHNPNGDDDSQASEPTCDSGSKVTCDSDGVGSIIQYSNDDCSGDIYSTILFE